MMEFIKKNWKDLLIFALAFVVVCLLYSTSCSNRKISVCENNMRALQDVVKTIRLENGELLYEKQGFISEKKELEENLEISRKEVRELERKLNSSLATIAKLDGSVKIDTIVLTDSVYIMPDSNINIRFKYDDDWLSLSGASVYNHKSNTSKTTLYGIHMDVPVKVGTTKDNKWFVSTQNPYVTFTDITGANVNETNRKRWSVGVQCGVGVIGGYGASGGNDGVVRSGWIVGTGLYVGFGITYKLWEF